MHVNVKIRVTLTWQSIRIIFVVCPLSYAVAVVILALLARTILGLKRITDWCHASVGDKRFTVILVVLIALLYHVGHFASFAIALDDKTIINRPSLLIQLLTAINIVFVFFMFYGPIFSIFSVWIRPVRKGKFFIIFISNISCKIIRSCRAITKFLFELELIVEWDFADWTFIISHLALSDFIWTSAAFVEACTKSAVFTEDRFAYFAS